jgi:2-polyprenyl-3-methyl-5-hydroxy-6-metoxy-1,4-benzoquinol methylase
MEQAEQNIPKDQKELDYTKVNEMYRERSKLGAQHSVLAGSSDETAIHTDILLDYITRKELIKSLGTIKNKKIIDFGCGTGRLSTILASKSAQVIGLDTSEELLKLARAKNPELDIDYRQISFEFTPIETKNIYRIFTVGVLYHLNDENLKQRLTDFKNILSADGEFIFLEHVSPVDRVLSNIGKQRSMLTWQQMITEAGMKIINAKPILRMPSYSFWLWNKFNIRFNLLLPLFHLIEKLTVNRKKEAANYHYYVFKCKRI